MSEFYGSVEDNGDLPDDLNFDMTDQEFAEAQRMLGILEMSDWSWTILDVLKQPQDLLDNIVLLKYIGNKISIQARNKNGQH